MPLRVCFVALNAYPAIDPQEPGGFGGIETRSWLFARGLAQLPDVEVSFLVRHGKALRKEEFDGVRLLLLKDPLYAVRDSLLSRLKRTPTFPWLKLQQPRLSDLFYLPWIAARKLLVPRPSPLTPDPFLQQLNADVLVTFGVQSHSATVIASARAAGRPAVLFLGSDGDLDERYLQRGDFVSVYRDRGDVCLWVLQQADSILCQTPAQQSRLRDLFHRQATIVRNPIDLQEWDRLRALLPSPEETAGLTRYALWIGRADAVHKRPQLLLDVAERCPEIPFLMVMNRRDDVVDAEVRRRAPGNVRIVESIPFARMPAVMQQAAVLVNTSSLEGFPNTYLQAAATGVPVASLQVEEEFLRQSGAGTFAGGDLQLLAEQVRQFWTPGRPAAQSEQARAFVEEYYSLQGQVRQLAAQLRKIADEYQAHPIVNS
ncbi:glycosyltransferase family 4 protein [Planctomicrobium sp. SH664]|uniref:glycosyltransferase family 4 protein n=1 Tax=Planctomicrobium sp. SH664 TaxID=3448125 RepID=UPI003F5AF48E